MNGAATDTNLQFNTILNLLSNKEDKSLKEKLVDKFTKEKAEEERRNRYRQKERLYQAIPIVLDGVTLDGKKGLKSLKSLFSFPEPSFKDKKTKDIPDILKYAFLIGGLLVAAYIFLKNKWEEVMNAIDAFLKTFNLSNKLNTFFTKLFSAEKLTELEKLLKLKASEFIGKIFNAQKYDELMKLSPKTKELFTRFKDIPEKYLKMTVEELDKTIKSRINTTKEITYGNKFKTKSGFELLTDDLKEFSNLKKGGKSTADVAKAVEEFNKTNSAIQDTVKTIEGPLKAATGGVGKFFDDIGKFFDEFLKIMPWGDKISKVVNFLKKYGGPLGVIIDTFETAFHLFDKNKKGDLGKEEITTAITTLVLRAIGWLGSIILFPLAFLKREDMEGTINKIFEEEDIFMKIGRMFGAIVDIIIKSLGGTIDFIGQAVLLGAKLLRKIDQWFFGGTGEKGMFETVLEEFLHQFSIEIKNFNYVDFVAPVSDFIADLLTPFVVLFTDTDAFMDTYIRPLKEWSEKKLASIGDSLKDTLDKVVNWLKEIFTWENIKEFILTSNPMSKAIAAGGKWVGDMFNGDEKEQQKIPAGPVQDLVDDNERILYSKGEAHIFDKNDQIVALKKGGPIQEALASIDMKTKESVDQLRSSVEQISKTLNEYLNKAEKLYDAEFKLMTSNNEILQQIKDKEAANSNVVVNNSSNNMVFSHKTSSNNEYRSELANRVFAY